MRSRWSMPLILPNCPSAHGRSSGPVSRARRPPTATFPTERAPKPGQTTRHNARCVGNVSRQDQRGGVEDRLKGVQTTAQLLAGGLSAGQIRRLNRDGTLRRLRHGVYAPAATVTSVVRAPRETNAEQLLQLAAALAATSSQSVGSHRSAGRVYGLGLVGRDREQIMEITRAPGDRSGHTARLGVLVHVARLPPDHVVSYRGVP